VQLLDVLRVGLAVLGVGHDLDSIQINHRSSFVLLAPQAQPVFSWQGVLQMAEVRQHVDG